MLNRCGTWSYCSVACGIFLGPGRWILYHFTLASRFFTTEPPGTPPDRINRPWGSMENFLDKGLLFRAALKHDQCVRTSIVGTRSMIGSLIGFVQQIDCFRLFLPLRIFRKIIVIIISRWFLNFKHSKIIGEIFKCTDFQHLASETLIWSTIPPVCMVNRNFQEIVVKADVVFVF